MSLYKVYSLLKLKLKAARKTKSKPSNHKSSFKSATKDFFKKCPSVRNYSHSNILSPKCLIHSRIRNSTRTIIHTHTNKNYTNTHMYIVHRAQLALTKCFSFFSLTHNIFFKQTNSSQKYSLLSWIYSLWSITNCQFLYDNIISLSLFSLSFKEIRKRKRIKTV